jgi:hypothetical protein
MNRKNPVTAVAIILTTLMGLFLPRAHALPVTMELVLLSDISISVDFDDFVLQRSGYENAFRNPAVIGAIESNGPIAVTWVLWAMEQEQVVPWTLLTDATDSNGFADAIAATGRPWLLNETGIADALDFGASLFADNGFEGQRRVIDIAGDGAESVLSEYYDPISPAVQTARDNALNNLGVTSINALWIENPPWFGTDPGDTINCLDYGTNNVIGGLNAFQIVVEDFEDFSPAITTKVLGEFLNGPAVPEPTCLALLTVALVVLGISRKRALA